jgi:hypothetical protein
MASSTQDLLADLNPHQLKAVQENDKPLLIIAGAGSGKTKVITTKVSSLLQNGVKPENEGLETHFKNARAVRIVPGTTGEIDVIKDALTKYLEENNIVSEISNIEMLENEGYVINVRVKNLDQYAGSGSLYNKLYDIVLENGSQATIVLNLEPM